MAWVVLVVCGGMGCFGVVRWNGLFWLYVVVYGGMGCYGGSVAIGGCSAMLMFLFC